MLAFFFFASLLYTANLDVDFTMHKDNDNDGMLDNHCSTLTTGKKQSESYDYRLVVDCYGGDGRVVVKDRLDYIE